MSALHPLLQGQLSMLGVGHDPDELTPRSWQTILAWVSEHYRQMGEERQRLRESLEVELHAALREFVGERERGRRRLDAVTVAVALLLDAVASRRATALPAALRRALAGDTDSAEAHDELAHVRSQFGELGAELVDLLTASPGADDAERSLAAAGAVQRRWMPGDRPMRIGRVEIAGHARAAGPCGGDWWTMTPLEDGRVLIVLADATGHGADSALMTGVAKGACDQLVRLLQPRPLRVGALLEALNVSIWDAGQQTMMMTCTAAVLDAANGRLTAASAGHPLPYLLRASGALEQVHATGPALGAERGARYEEVEVALEPHDTVIWYTDGLLECEDRSHRQFGPGRLRRLLAQAPSGEPAALRTTLRRAVARFTDGAPAADDLAFAIARLAR